MMAVLNILLNISMMIKRDVNDDEEGNHEYLNATEWGFKRRE